MENFIPRKNQTAIVDHTGNHLDNGEKFIVIKAPTGAGKSYIQEMLSSRFKNVLITTPRINLTHQTASSRNGWGVIQGKNRIPTQGNVTVATLHTILNLIKKDKFNMNHYEAVFIDEIHIMATKPSKKRYTMGNLIQDLLANGITVIGFTATPTDAKGNRLEILADAKDGTPPKWQEYEPYFEEGYLVRPLVKKIGRVNRDILHSSSGDYTEESQLEAIADSQIDVVETILKYRKGKTLIMAVNIEHAEAIHDDLVMRGQRSIITHSNNDTEVKEAVDALKNDVVDFAVSIGTMHTGTDIPMLETVAMACLTKSIPKRDQFAGRGARCYGDKKFFLFLDLFGSTDEIGLPFTTPKPTEEGASGSRKPKCKECGSQRPYELVDVEQNLGETIKTFKCLDCGFEDVKIISKMVETCEHCFAAQEITNVLSVKGEAVFKCKECEEYSFLAELTPKEMVVTFANRDSALKTIVELSKDKLADNQQLLERFLVSFGLFAKYAQLEHLSAVVDYAGDFKAKYSIGSIEKVIGRMDGFYSQTKDKTSLLIDGMYEIYGECNYELENWINEHLKEVGLDNTQTRKAILTKMRVRTFNGEPSGWKIKNPIDNTKKYKTLIKRFTTYLLKQRVS